MAEKTNRKPQVRIYLSHPFGGKEENRERAEAIAKIYREIWDSEGKENWEILNPLEYFRDFQDMEDYTVLRMAVNLMKTCDGILWAPGWKRSRGCRYEHWIAHHADNLRIRYFQAEIPEGVLA